MIHAYKNNGYNIVLDVNSGSVHVVDDVVFDLTEVVESKLKDKYGTAATQNNKDNGNEYNSDVEWIYRDILSSTDLSQKYPEEEIREGIEELMELRDAEVLYT
ncbi:MAG: thioether cross-link-forming SCIFF peptide maturase, partial [Lachnospiraceae bacterium]|nr:thioether cross-link-forming SCIFF peptide maturase [Lachnospiraceae bacterium]